MRHSILLLGILLSLTIPGGYAAEASGELTSDAPVRFYGDGRAVGDGLAAYHHAFRDGSISGKVYSGVVVEHRNLHVAPDQPFDCINAYDGKEETESGPIADPQAPYNVIDFGLAQGAFARVRFPGDALFSIGEVGKPQDLANPFLYAGPNPYPHRDAAQDEAQDDDHLVPAFATTPFAAVPAGAFNTVGPLTLELHWGEMKTIQRERERTHRAGVFQETRDPQNPSPLTPPIPCQVEVVRWIEFTQTVVVATIDQSGAERALAYWHGEEAARAGGSDTPGYWDRSRGADFARALEDLKLPATLVAAPGFRLVLDGKVRFDNALGSVAVGGRLHEAKDASLELSGPVNVEPVASDESHRMTSRIGGDVASVAIDGAAGRGLEWTLDVPTTMAVAAGAAALGSAAWAWPVFKFKGTQWLLFPLYARLKKEDLLENPLRDDILVVVQGSPGISASELGRRLECGWGTLVYHLTVLERMQLISSAREGRHKRFFVQGRINYSDKAAVGLLANPSARTILDAVRERPGLIQRDLGRILGLSPGTVAWHVERLAEAGLILKEEEGRVVRYYPSAKLLELTRQLAA